MNRTLGVMLAAVCVVCGQDAFEVASVKRSAPDARGGMGLGEPPGRIAYKAASMSLILQRAYNVQEPQIEGPEWLAKERYDFEAKLPEGATREQIPAMLRALLAERFRLAAHTVTKEASVYALVVGKGGSKLTEAKSTPMTPRPMDRSGIHMRQNFTMANFARFLSIQLRGPVEDQTKLEGLYALSLDYTTEDFLARMQVKDVEFAPSLVTAVSEQLGLKLEARKTPVEFLVVDRIEKIPTEN